MTIQKLSVRLLSAGAILLAAACQTEPIDHCSISLRPSLATAMRVAEDKLSSGCEYSFDDYFSQLLEIAAKNPDAENRRLFSDFLVRVSDEGIVSKRQARSRYNRYFNIKFVSLAGDYNTCSQTCPVQDKVLADMQVELLDKELGLVQASEDSASYYRADHLLKQAQLVLEATCKACDAGGTR